MTGSDASRTVGRNMFALVLSQLITTPLSMVVNAMLARSLGATSFGAIYFATTFLTIAFLFVEWGGISQVTAAVARRRDDAGRIVGTGLVMRALLAGTVLVVVPVFSGHVGYSAEVRLALMLCGIRFAIASVTSLFTATLRGFEKVHWDATVTVCGAIAEAALVGSVLLMGAGLKGALIADVFAGSITAVVAFGLFLRVHAGRLAIDRRAMRILMGGGFTFLVLDVVVKLQPMIDASFLSSLVPGYVLGWHSAAARIIVVLSFPALTLHTALYPTISRLWDTDKPAYLLMVRGALRLTAVIGAMAAMGTALFADLLISIVYGRSLYDAAVLNLQLLSVYVVLVYTSIVAAAALAAARRQTAWMVAQSFCLIVSLVLDPLLIPIAQVRFGNGSIGVCVSLIVAEIAMATCGLALLPKGVLDRSLFRTLWRCAAAATGMGVTATLLHRFPPAAIVGSTGVYAAVLYAFGEVDMSFLQMLRGAVVSRLAARAGKADPQPSLSVSAES